MRLRLLLPSLVAITCCAGSAQDLTTVAVVRGAFPVAATNSSTTFSQQTPAGPLTPPAFSLFSSVQNASASFQWSQSRPDNFMLTANVAVNPFASTPARAVVGPFDILLSLTFSSPSDASIQIENLFTYVGVGTSFSVRADIGDDGVVDYVATNGFGLDTLPLPAGSTSALVRLTGLLRTTVPDQVATQLKFRIVPTERCAIDEVAPSCVTGGAFAASPRFDGGIELSWFGGPDFGTPPLAVIGFSTVSAPLPIASSTGFCVLTPSPDIVLPLTAGTQPTTYGLTIPRFVSPTTPLPFTFFAQSLNFDPGVTLVETAQAYRITCP